MKILTRDSIFKKVIITIIIVILCNFSLPPISYGIDLVDPITSFLVVLPDGIFYLLQKFFMSDSAGEVEIEVHTDKIDELTEEQEGFKDNQGAMDYLMFPIGAALGLGLPGLIAATINFISDDGNFDMINIQYTPYAIFTNQIGMLNADFFHTENTEYEEGKLDSAEILKPVVSKWYGILRSIALIGLLTVLVYIAIRILISSASQDKAKYKQMLKDWAVAMCLVFVLHYIMSFTMLTVKYITDAFSGAEGMEYIEVEMPSDIECNEGDEESKKAFEAHLVNPEKSKEEPTKWKMNIVEYIRFCIEALEDENTKKLGFTIMYIILCIITCIFTFQYLKRVIYLAILTLLAPLIALTYPIDKISDGQAQGFNMWLKEYIFNTLLQVIHLILYTIIMTSAVELVKSNVIYGIAALGCLTMTEKLLRKFFGFEKANTVGAFGGAAGAAVLMSTLGKMKKSKGGKSNTKSGSNSPKLWNNKESLDAEGILKNDEGFIKKSQDGEEKADSSLSQQNNNGKNLVNSSDLGNSVTEKTHNNGTNTPKANTTVTVSNNNIPKNTTQNKTKKKVKSPRRAAIGYAAKNFKRRHNINGRSIRNMVGRGIVKGAGATIGATVGLAAGIASGDMSKSLEYATAGAMATGTVAGKIGHSVAQGVSNIRDDYKQGLAAADPSIASEQRYKEFEESEENQQYLESRYVDADEREQVYDLAKDAARYKLDDVETVSAMHEMEKNGYTREQALAIAKISNKIGDITKPKDKKEQIEALITSGFSPEQANKVIKSVEKHNKYKK